MRSLEPYTWAKWGQLHPAVVCILQQLLIHRVGLLHEFLSWQQMQKMKTCSVYPYFQSICINSIHTRQIDLSVLTDSCEKLTFSYPSGKIIKKKKKSNNYKKRKEVENFSAAFFQLWPSPTSIGLKPVLHIQKEGILALGCIHRRVLFTDSKKKQCCLKLQKGPWVPLLNEQFA